MSSVQFIEYNWIASTMHIMWIEFLFGECTSYFFAFEVMISWELASYSTYWREQLCPIFIWVLVSIGLAYVVTHSFAPYPNERCSLHTSIAVFPVRSFFRSFPSFWLKWCFRAFCTKMCESCLSACMCSI